MKEKLERIEVIPAKLISIDIKNNRYLVRCLIDDDYVEDRYFDYKLFQGICSLNKFLIEIMVFSTHSKIKILNDGEFEKLYNENWKLLDI